MVGGNQKAVLWRCTGTEKNALGEQILRWEQAAELWGWLDYLNGEAKYSQYDAKITESSHVFLCDYREMNDKAAERYRMEIDGKGYDVTLIDDPMGLGDHLEFFLNYTGGIGWNFG